MLSSLCTIMALFQFCVVVGSSRYLLKSLIIVLSNSSHPCLMASTITPYSPDALLFFISDREFRTSSIVIHISYLLIIGLIQEIYSCSTSFSCSLLFGLSFSVISALPLLSFQCSTFMPLFY